MSTSSGMINYIQFLENNMKTTQCFLDNKILKIDSSLVFSSFLLIIYPNKGVCFSSIMNEPLSTKICKIFKNKHCKFQLYAVTNLFIWAIASCVCSTDLQRTTLGFIKDLIQYPNPLFRLAIAVCVPCPLRWLQTHPVVTRILCALRLLSNIPCNKTVVIFYS